MELQNLISQNEHEKAFASVLQMQSLDLLVWLCNKVGPGDTGSRPFSQIIVLSLVQQLTVALDKDTAVKLAWLQAILPRLNVRDPQIAANVPKILEQVAANVNGCTTVRADGSHPCHAQLLGVSAKLARMQSL